MILLLSVQMFEAFFKVVVEAVHVNVASGAVGAIVQIFYG